MFGGSTAYLVARSEYSHANKGLHKSGVQICGRC